MPTLITLAALLFLGAVFTGVWTDRLWFRSVGFGSVYRTMLTTRVVMFVTFGLVFAAVVVANIVIAYRTRPMTVAQLDRSDPVMRYRQAIDPLRTIALAGLGLLLTVFAGSAAAGQWRTFQMWRNGTSFGQRDPQFNKDVGFYVFDLPWIGFLVSYGFALLIVTGIAVLLVHYVYGGISLQPRDRRISRAATVHLSVIIGLGILLRALGYYLDRFGFMNSDTGLIDGPTFTDVNARIPSKNILIVIAIICALLFFANVIRQTLLLPAIGLGLLLLSAILIGGIWPAVMQSFQVRPSEPDKEAPYIERNIEATRDAYNVAGTEKTNYTGSTSLTPTELTQSAESRVSTRLLDPTLVSPAFQQLQQVRGYYTVPDTLDVDRYQLPGSDIAQDIVIAARELNLDGLQASQRNWANDHTVYTHGYGVIAARGNQRGDQGQPVWVERDIPPTGDLDIQTPPRIYFGENSPSYSIVGRPDGAAPIEVDIPRGGGGDDSDSNAEAAATQNTYDGDGGVPVGSLFNKLLYAIKFSEPNIVLSSRVNENSKILYDRHPRDRVNRVAPWLTVDGDPYPAVVGGRVVWIVDGYTTSNSYPYSQKVSLDDATSDTLTQGGAQVRLPSDEVNYMRNSVKAVVDAYDGSVDLYQWDEKDPILKTWMKTFPGTVKPKSDISEDLLKHLRYPVDIFKVQREMLSRYHVTDPQTFYEDGERWQVPTDPAGTADSKQPPYYLSVTQPTQPDAGPRFSLTSVYLPNSRENLASYVSVNSEASDTENYGKLEILQLNADTQVDGPSQIANKFSADPGVRQALLPFTQSSGTSVVYGNLLTLPVSDALLYVQPVYVRRDSASGTFPVLQYVVASFGDDVGYGQSLDEALRVALGLQAGDTSGDSQAGTGDTGGDSGDDSGDAGGGAEGQTQTTDQLLTQASAEYDAAQKALADGDLAEYQTRINAMNTLIDRARATLGSAATPAPSETPSADANG
ncbi:UPF0182 family protein [Solicola sp. PLA-1-18]|uniref:UPF0182 family membrane protein n=1 Tax=Solicola sp. PLA-1-18 TaxID=3380532 RepID=UPI003B76D420